MPVGLLDNASQMDFRQSGFNRTHVTPQYLSNTRARQHSNQADKDKLGTYKMEMDSLQCVWQQTDTRYTFFLKYWEAGSLNLFC